ncbi:hypothetical protein L2E82_22972 [Cichorium intybus]|uniref:Uncharacterized protein n=1 Tax=Cichorium intybus TaxID=13427 RepID=A0ACB9DZJ5_CICIN|nr:hypothetical protein L2E82_22972 [Cichorium intybus]
MDSNIPVDIPSFYDFSTLIEIERSEQEALKESMEASMVPVFEGKLYNKPSQHIFYWRLLCGSLVIGLRTGDATGTYNIPLAWVLMQLWIITSGSFFEMEFQELVDHVKNMVTELSANPMTTTQLVWIRGSYEG